MTENKPFCPVEVHKDPSLMDTRNYKFCFEEMYRNEKDEWICPKHGSYNGKS